MEYGFGTDPCVSNGPWTPVMFNPADAYNAGGTLFRMDAGDLNGDGHVDVVVAHDGAAYSVYLNQGDGTSRSANIRRATGTATSR